MKLIPAKEALDIARLVEPVIAAGVERVIAEIDREIREAAKNKKLHITWNKYPFSPIMILGRNCDRADKEVQRRVLDALKDAGYVVRGVESVTPAEDGVTISWD